MDADSTERGAEFDRLMTFVWQVNNRETHWGDKAWQLMMNVGETEAQNSYNLIQEQTLGQRGKYTWDTVFTNNNINYICKEVLTDNNSYYDEKG